MLIGSALGSRPRNLTVWWHAPFGTPSGYGVEALDFVRALARHAPEVTLAVTHSGDLYSHEYVSSLTDTDREKLSAAIDRGHQCTRTPQRCVAVCHTPPPAWFPPDFATTPCPASLNFRPAGSAGRTMFESDRIPSGWVERIATTVSELWVPTAASAAAFVAAGVAADAVHVVPEPLDTAFFASARAQRAGTPLLPASVRALRSERGVGGVRPFVFLSVFKWEPRKGWATLLAAYFAEFAGDGGVALVLHVRGIAADDAADAVAAAARRHTPAGKTPARVVISADPLPAAAMPALYGAADAFVLPTRGEGWCRPLVEAMAAGVPAVVTNWSGPAAIATAATAFLIPPGRLAPLPGADEELRRHLFATPEVAAVRAMMRLVVEAPVLAAAVAAAARRDVAARFGLRPAAAAVVARLAARGWVVPPPPDGEVGRGGSECRG